MTTATRDILEEAAALDGLIREHADATERERSVAVPVIDGMRRAGIFRMGVPEAFGGLELDLATQLRAIERLAIADGSSGWVAMIGAGTGTIAGQLEPDIAREIFREDTIAVGAIAPTGRADPVEGGIRCSGRWAFGSGCQHADWIFNGCMVFDGDAPRMLEGGLPDWRLVGLPAADVQVIDTWNVSGLRGTGSHDLAVKDVFVPADRYVTLLSGQRMQPGPLYAFPTFGLLSAQVAAVALGIGRAALDEIRALAQTKTPMGSPSKLIEKPLTHHDYAHAESSLRSGRAFLFDVVEETWDAVARGAEVSREQQALVRLAAAHATACAVRAVDQAYTMGGGSSLYASNLLQRQFRDIHAVTQHITVNAGNYEGMGRVLIGNDPGGIL